VIYFNDSLIITGNKAKEKGRTDIVQKFP